MSELAKLTIHELHQKIKNKSVSAVEVTQSVWQRIKKYDKKIQAYLTVCEKEPLKQAAEVDAEVAKGFKAQVLTGIPLAPKDIYMTKNIPTTAGSKILREYIPPYNATVIEKCLAQNCVIMGKTNMDEFAMGSSNENSAFQNCHNPWDLKRTPGGSSGGSAAAVSADLCIAALGTDTGGSIRQPAAHCGVVGLKPTYGRVSRYGVIAFASSLDQMGPITKDVEDCAILLSAIAGHDVQDSTSIDCQVPDYTKFLNQKIKGLKIGIPKDFFIKGMDADVKLAVEIALQQMEELGAKVVEISLPHTKYAVPTYYIIAPAECSANLARYDGVRFGFRDHNDALIEMYKGTRGKGFGKEVKRRIMTGTYVLSSGYYDAYYVKAQKVRTLIHADYLQAFKKVDVIAGPVSPTTAFKLGEKSNDPLEMYLSDVLTISANLSGLPAMSVPCGFDGKKLPVGLQLIGKAFDEGSLLQVAHAYEQSTSWHKQKPCLEFI